MDLNALYTSYLKLFSARNFSKDIPQRRILKSVIVKGSCVVCENSDNLRSMDKDYYFNGVKEHYSTMLLHCFQLQIIGLNSQDGDSEICETCILSLRTAFAFRKQVEDLDQTFNDKIFNGLLENTSIQSDKELDTNLMSVEAVPDDDIPSDTSIVKVDLKKSKPKNVPKKRIRKRKLVCGMENGRASPSFDENVRNCPKCPESFDNHDELLIHYQKHDHNYLCYICGKVCQSKTHFYYHVKSHSGNVYECKHCSKTYTNSGTLFQHVKVKHKNVGLYICSMCPERFRDDYAKNKHALAVHGIPRKSFSCPKCSRIFYQYSLMTNHIKREHLKVRRYSCDSCDYGCFDKTTLIHHMHCHTGIKDFHCEVCGKRYSRKKTLKEHLKIHYNIRAHKCTVCEMAFVQKCSLKRHVATHHKSEDL